MNKSLSQVMLAGIRLAGPGTYHPAHIKADGTLVNARWVGRFFMNDFYFDANNVRQESSCVISVTAWNGRNAPAGKGLADRMAKYCAPGKEIAVALARINVFEGRVFQPAVQGQVSQPYTHPDGSLIMVEKTSYVLDGSSVRFGNDSAKQLATEAAQFIANGGLMTFDARPADWNTPGAIGNKQWEGISAWRTSQCFDPQYPTYGYAKVGTVNGTPVASHAVGGAVQQPAANAAAAVVTQAAPVVTQPVGPSAAATTGTAVNANGAGFPAAPVVDGSGTAVGGPATHY